MNSVLFNYAVANQTLAKHNRFLLELFTVVCEGRDKFEEGIILVVVVYNEKSTLVSIKVVK